MAKQDLEAELGAVNALAGLSPEEALPGLRRALGHRSNLIVSRAARHVAALGLKQLVPELVEQFYRFMKDPVKTDPQCWAKNEIAKALAELDAQEPELYLLGMKHHQMEPTWGGPSDTSGPLRGACALALVMCREVSSPVVLRHLTPLFRDKDLPVRVNAARAMEQLGSETAALLLRFRAELGSDEPELLGACISGVLRLEGESALPWVAAFLEHEDDLAPEAAFALAEHRTPEALAQLKAAHGTVMDREFRAVLLAAIAATRLPEAQAWLLALVRSESLDARAARKAMADAGWVVE